MISRSIRPPGFPRGRGSGAFAATEVGGFGGGAEALAEGAAVEEGRGAAAEEDVPVGGGGATAEAETFGEGTSGRRAGRPPQARARSAVAAVTADVARKRAFFERRTRGRHALGAVVPSI